MELLPKKLIHEKRSFTVLEKVRIRMDKRFALVLLLVVTMTTAMTLRDRFFYNENDEGEVDKGFLPIRDQRGCIRCERRFLSPVQCCNGQKCSFLHGCFD
ncbi:hypothetical protein ACROYT_G002131 [Oculina patagonica]